MKKGNGAVMAEVVGQDVHDLINIDWRCDVKMTLARCRRVCILRLMQSEGPLVSRSDAERGDVAAAVAHPKVTSLEGPKFFRFRTVAAVHWQGEPAHIADRMAGEDLDRGAHRLGSAEAGD